MKPTNPLTHAALLALVLCAPALAHADPSGPSGAPDAPLAGGSVQAEVDGRTVPFPLLKTDAAVHIDGDLATVELVQTFDNPLNQPVHARYIFPLPPNAAVHAMKLVTGDQVVRGVVQRKAEAQATFDAAQRAGKQAALLTQHRPNVFSQQVAHLVPGQPITVEISYAHVVPKRDGAYHFHFPMVVGPRYLPADRSTDGDPPPLQVGQWNLPASPPVGGLSAPPAAIDPERVHIEVHLDGGRAVRGLSSPSHGLDVQRPSAAARVVRLASGRTIDNQDFVLHYRLSDDHAASVGATAWRDPEGEADGVVSLLVEPPAGAPEAQVTPREMVFVLDCSGSMHGEPMDASKRFMRRALETLRPGDHFRVIRFSDSASAFNAHPLPATPENLRRASTFIDQLEGQGGTEMTWGIRAALDPAPIPGAMRIVVFLTDGYIGNDVDVVRMVRARRGETRLFSFGIGRSVNRYLLEEMARAGRGLARFVRPEEDAEGAADRLAERLRAPYLTDVAVDWGKAPVFDATPARLPDLFLGESVRVLARYRCSTGGADCGTHRVTVRGRVAGQPVSLPLDVTLPRSAPDADALPIVWARGQIADRMHTYLTPGLEPAARETVQEEVVQLGLTHQLVTQWTSFVAVADRVVNPAPEAVARADVAVPQVSGVSQHAYPQFSGSGAPEPHEYAAMLLLMLMAWMATRAGATGTRGA
jgi:Ca-activated chloride channel family protein